MRSEGYSTWSSLCVAVCLSVCVSVTTFSATTRKKATPTAGWIKCRERTPRATTYRSRTSDHAPTPPRRHRTSSSMLIGVKCRERTQRATTSRSRTGCLPPGWIMIGAGHRLGLGLGLGNRQIQPIDAISCIPFLLFFYSPLKRTPAAVETSGENSD